MDLRKLPDDIRKDSQATTAEWVAYTIAMPILVAAAFSLIALLIALSAPETQPVAGEVAAFAAAVALVTGILTGSWILVSRIDKRAERLLIERAKSNVDEADRQVAEATEDSTGFGVIWGAAQKRLDLYHATARLQSERSFKYALIAASVGLAAGVACAALAIRAEGTSGAVTAGGLGAILTALAGYIGTTFMRAYFAASQQLRTYFEQASETWRYLSAERLIQQIENGPAHDARNQVISMLATTIATSTTHQKPAPAETATTRGGPAGG